VARYSDTVLKYIRSVHIISDKNQRLVKICSTFLGGDT
jgi:hypothetical protein